MTSRLSTWSPRRTESVSLEPILASTIRRCRSPALVTPTSPTDTMTSPARSLPPAAGLPPTTSCTSTPALRPSRRAIAGVRGRVPPALPRYARRTRPLRIRADDVAVERRSIDEGRARRTARRHDVGRGDQEAVGGDDDAGAGTAETAAAPPDAQAGDRRENLLRDGGDDRRIGVEGFALGRCLDHGAYKITK